MTSRKQIIQIEILGFDDRFKLIDHWAFDTQIVYLEDHLIFPTDDRGIQHVISQLNQPLSTSHWESFAKGSL